MAEDNELDGYFVIKPEKINQLAGDTERMYHMVSDTLQDAVVSSDIREWQDSAIPLLMEYYLALRDLKLLIYNTINNPPKNIIKMMKKHNIKDFLIKDLLTLNQTLLETETLEKDLMIEYKISLNLH